MERPRLPYTVTEPDSPQAQGSGQGQALEGQAAAPRAEQLPGPACVFTETTVTRCPHGCAYSNPALVPSHA